ncbi:DUF2501 domain-containing protein [Pectobacterium brasiliense]|uniref:DUF2501 domain-containing protein n=1 Tax=Pectobacterium TaxID=122277 RepID=UPI001968ADB0|nr:MULTISPECIES: DUF2501 domain-containing protein [Pectobacterium]MCA5921933.1 DUF2501 domain-containing protein [Pectobacterium brasiliense]MCA5929258.1 DUF2501 domain-containing protein [Pectobacterium brasiliense]MCA5937925.1 DUF2501 domain-containing protein [Pectobacterium brasiliense]MCA5942215.1 DUF2501 domain-containing protein [Pectobacterium brasiliense]MCA5946477.1 DUF2501 domain-containing protein [Pectobacterium brasiliense]
MKSVRNAVGVVGLAIFIVSGYVQAASLQDSLSNAVGQFSQNNSSSEALSGLSGLLTNGNQALSAGNMNNAAGILQYCLKQKLVSATNTENIKNQLLDKLGLSSQDEKKQTDYTQGLAGLLNTRDGKQLNLNNIGNTPLAEKVKTKACDLVLKQGIKFIS